MSRECPECREEYDYYNQGGPEMFGPPDEEMESMQKEKLKTLKDISNEDDCGCCASKKRLRQEVIKWIKKMEGCSEFCLRCGASHPYSGVKKCGSSYGDSFISEYDYETTDISGAIVWIKHFFNITEEELNHDEEIKT